MDYDNVHLNVAPMHDILQDALDDLVSTRTSTITKGDALMAIEHVLAETSDPRAVGLPGYFNALQDTFQCNVSSRIIAWTAATSPLLDKCLNKGSTENDKKFEVTVLSAQLAQAMGIIQGVALVHKPSKQFLGRRYSLEVLLDLLLVSRHLSPSTAASSTPTSPKAGATSVPTPPATEVPLASIIIDTLLCILVDSVPSLRVFEDLNGVQVVVRILKRAGTPREVRMKCLEFLYFYLLDETVPPEASNASDTTQLSISDLPPMPTPSPSPSHRPHPSIPATSQSSYMTSSPSSRSSSASSAFSVLSTSTTATSASLHESPAPTKADPSERAPKDAPQSTRPFRPASKPVIPGLNPTNRTVTPPNGGASALGRGQPRSLLMLKKEVDYIPLSPKKPQLSHLGRGPSGLRPKLTERTSSSKLVPKLHPSGAVLSEDTEGDGSGKSPVIARTPRRIGTHSRGLSVSSISSLSSTTSTASTASTTSASASHSGAPSESKTPSRDKGKSKALAAAEFETPKASSKLHRRTQSLADFTSDSPSPSSLKTGPRSASSPTAGAGAKNRGARTMQEKKDILGTMLGNVDALVEGVKKAGVWGLNS